MLKSVRVPPPFEPHFAKAEQIVEGQFSRFHRDPSQGMLHIGEDRYVLVRAEGFYLGWFDAMAETFGSEVAVLRSLGHKVTDCACLHERRLKEG
jgi:hypothetical protein